MKINKLLSSYNSSPRYGTDIKYIVIHYVGAISTAKDNCRYFRGGDRRASAHFFVDSAIWQSIPCSRSAWHCGGGLQDYGMKKGGAKFHKICTNSNSIGIELCCYRKHGRIIPTPTAIRTAIPLVKWLMKKYDIPATRVIRHFDVTGKCCPNGYIDHDRWIRLRDKLTGITVTEKKTPVYPTKDLIKGNTGAQVLRLQKCLNKIMNAKLTLDSSFGNATFKAVKIFQKKYKLTIDGSVGPKTRAKIKALV